jgi:hypothetical protein
MQMEWGFPLQMSLSNGVGIPTPNEPLKRSGNAHPPPKKNPAARRGGDVGPRKGGGERGRRGGERREKKKKGIYILLKNFIIATFLLYFKEII